MLRLFVVDPPHPNDRWAPFLGVRPIGELRAGAWRIWERWQRALAADQIWSVAPTCTAFADADALPLADPATIVGPAIVVRSDFIPIGDPIDLSDAPQTLGIDGLTVGWILEPGERWSTNARPGRRLEVPGLRLAGTPDLLGALEQLLARDCAQRGETPHDGVPPGAIVLGDAQHIIVRNAAVEPHVVFDVRKGPIVLEPGVQVRTGTRLEGPLYVAEQSWLLGGAIRHTVVGPHCRVHGEVAHTIFLGYANKGHDGFVGHSVIGHWVNLGAGTITSNLKNTYGPIRLDLPGGRYDTGRTNLGSLIGDHAKTAIGSLLSTGTVIGAAANVVANPVPRYVRPFTWAAAGRLTVDGFLTMANRVMPRRGVEVTPLIEASLRELHTRFGE